MRVHVKLSTTLRDCVAGYAPERGVEAEMPEGGTAAELAARIGLPADEIKIIMINGRQRGPDAPLHDGDRVAYFPAVGGG